MCFQEYLIHHSYDFKLTTLQLWWHLAQKQLKRPSESSLSCHHDALITSGEFLPSSNRLPGLKKDLSYDNSVLFVFLLCFTSFRFTPHILPVMDPPTYLHITTYLNIVELSVFELKMLRQKQTIQIFSPQKAGFPFLLCNNTHTVLSGLRGTLHMH